MSGGEYFDHGIYGIRNMEYGIVDRLCQALEIDEEHIQAPVFAATGCLGRHVCVLRPFPIEFQSDDVTKNDFSEIVGFIQLFGQPT